MTNYRQGSIVLVDFGFSEETGAKRRPALIISRENYNKNRQEVIVAAITSNIKRELFADTKVEQWKEAGLMRPSKVSGIIRTVKNRMIIRQLGSLTKQDFQNVQNSLGQVLGFKE